MAAVRCLAVAKEAKWGSTNRTLHIEDRALWISMTLIGLEIWPAVRM